MHGMLSISLLHGKEITPHLEWIKRMRLWNKIILLLSWIAIISLLQHSEMRANSLHRSLKRCRIATSRMSSLVVRAQRKDTIQALVQIEMQNSLVRAFGDEMKNIDPLVAIAKSAHGDYQANVAMSLSKKIRQKPIDIANKVISTMTFGDSIEKADISGPGFINLHLSQSLVQKKILSKLKDSSHRCGIKPTSDPMRIIVDFSSPNIAKEMHVGHLRSTIIGDCLSRVSEFLGHKVLRLNHVGDWGTQFGMLIRFLKEKYPLGSVSLDSDKRAAAEQLDIGDLVGFYKAAKLRFDSSPEFQVESRLEVVKLQAGDEENMRLWKLICEKSRIEFQSIYDILGINVLERGESFYNPMLENIVKELEEKGVAVNSDGAKCIFLPGYKGMDGKPLPLIVQKSDNGYLYATTDLAALKHRIDVEKGQRLIYVTDAGQGQHFAMVFEAAKLAGLIPLNSSVELSHVPFGLVLGEDGKKIKSRSGDSVKLRELLDEAISLAEKNFLARNAESSNDHISLQEKARVLGIGSIKYADLSMNRESDYKFSFSKMLSLSGNTAPYMLYAYVRIQGIKRKSAEAILKESISDADELDQKMMIIFQTMTYKDIILSEPEEILLCKHILRFDDVLLDVADKLYPNKLCEYIYDLSQKFNQFYEKCPVIKAPTAEQQISRLALCATTSDTLKVSLDLLGIETLDHI